MSNSIPQLFLGEDYYNVAPRYTKAERRRNGWLRNSFTYEAPASLFTGAASVLGLPEEKVDRLYESFCDTYLSKLKGNEFVEGIHVTLLHPADDGEKCHFIMDVTTAILDGDDKYQSRRDFDFLVEKPTHKQLRVLSNVVYHHYFIKPIHVQGLKVKKKGVWSELTGPGKDQTKKVEEESLIQHIQSALERGDKISLNRVPLIIHQDKLDRASRWFTFARDTGERRIS
tara:strand:+ start:4216 stop:4899 length:684 start_codon:yes stop_codon:yes gene_type:complete